MSLIFEIDAQGAELRNSFHLHSESFHLHSESFHLHSERSNPRAEVFTFTAKEVTRERKFSPSQGKK